LAVFIIDIDWGEAMIAKILGEESGQGIVEYVFILILVALACVVGFRAIGYSAGNRVNYVNSQVP